MPRKMSRYSLPIVFAFAFPNLVMSVHAQVVPGTGQQVLECFDDFEDPTWNFTLNLPKGSAEKDKQERHPSGFSANYQFLESLYRGTPDFVRRVETPPGGIPGSTGALAIQTLHSGIPGQLSYTFQQDDLIAAVLNKLGYAMPVSSTPSYTCRIYVPPLEKWERRHGSHFGYRADCLTTISTSKAVSRFFKSFNNISKREQYWPGFFLQLNLKEKSGQKEDFAQIVMRSDDRGHEVAGPKITHEGWWTFGMSFTPDGKVHYYAKEGVGNLTQKDHLYSSFPYGYKCEQTSTYFFNIVNQDDGHTWSTRFIVDDPKVYMATGSYRPSAQLQAALQKPAAAATATGPKLPVATPPVAIAKPVLTAPVQPLASQPVIPQSPTTVAAPASPSIPKLASVPVDIKANAPKEDKPVNEAIPTIPSPDSGEPKSLGNQDEEASAESEESAVESEEVTEEVESAAPAATDETPPSAESPSVVPPSPTSSPE